MIITKNTRILSIIKENKRSVDAIAAVAKPLQKLRNPLLQKMLAGRTTLAQAAKIGGCSIDELAVALKPLGFDWVNENESDEQGAFASTPEFISSLNKYPKTILDVREDLASGQDPLKKIMAAVKQLPEGNVLEVINTFEPTPLINLLSKKGYESYVETKSENEVHTFFKPGSGKEGQSQAIENELPDLCNETDFFEKLGYFGDKVVPVDVRELEMPMPMVTILESLSSLPEKHVLSVTHKRIPVFLFNELRERKADYLVYKAGETDVRLLIWRN